MKLKEENEIKIKIEISDTGKRNRT